MGNLVPGHHSEVPDSRVVQTKSGPIIGRKLIHEGDKQVEAFQGIPYAKPPIGELRFKKPEKPDTWTDTLSCKAFGARSIQSDLTFITKFQLGKTSEDCLTLNVFCPTWKPPQNKGFAVLVFIHGGGFVSDSCVKYGDIGICQHLVTKDLVVVTLQYRLGLLGFWSTGDDVCPGNNALWDMTLALQWVQDNITSFGGDPTNVTITGQSAGGCAVDLLSICPPSRDLFHKVIPMAGNASCGWSTSTNVIEICRQKAREFKVETISDSQQMLDELRKVPASEFALSMNMETKTTDFTSNQNIGPRLDGEFVTKEISELRRDAPSKPRMFGLCRAEGLLFGMSDTSAPMSRVEEAVAAITPETVYGNRTESIRRNMIDALIEPEKIHDEDARKHAVGEILSDLFLNKGTQLAVLQSVQADSESPTYFYSFDHFNSKMWGLLIGSRLLYKAATHCSEIPFLFGVGLISSFDMDDDDLKVLHLTTTLWSNFAKYGNPNGSNEENPLGGLIWQPANNENPQRHLVIDVQPRLENEFRKGRLMMLLEAEKEKELV